jgi:hypothetical protein
VTSSTRDSADRHLVDAALTEAERGLPAGRARLGRAMTAIAVFYFVTISGPNSIKVPAVAVALACIGLAPLALVGRRGERAGRCLLRINVLVVSLLAVVPISSSGDVPQNFVFFSSRQHYYYVIVAVSVLTLSPTLVLWTGLCAVAGLAGATAWIADGMEQIVSYRDLPSAPSREAYLAIVHDPNFRNIPVRMNEALVVALTTALAALAVYRARAVIAPCRRRGRRSRVSGSSALRAGAGIAIGIPVHLAGGAEKPRGPRSTLSDISDVSAAFETAGSQ